MKGSVGPRALFARPRQEWDCPRSDARAPIHAAMRADAMLDEGDLDGRSVWLRILKAVKELQSAEPGDRAVH